MKKPTRKEQREILARLEVLLGLFKGIRGDDPFAVNARAEYRQKLQELLAHAKERGLGEHPTTRFVAMKFYIYDAPFRT